MGEGEKQESGVGACEEVSAYVIGLNLEKMFNSRWTQADSYTTLPTPLLRPSLYASV